MQNHPQSKQLSTIYLSREQALETLTTNGFNLVVPEGLRVLGVPVPADTPTCLSIAWRAHWMRNSKQATTPDGFSKLVISAESLRQFMDKEQSASTAPDTLFQNLTHCIR